MTRTRRIPGWLLALLFFGVPLLEIILLVKVGQTIGVGWTILLLVADSVLGAWLVKHQGRRAMAALGDALASGRMPARELADGMLVLVGGVLMITPGFLSDLLGFLCILPFTRPVARRVLTRMVAARLVAGMPDMPGPDATRPRPGHPSSRGGDVVQGEVVDGPDD